ncbi:MAG TPA: hypothetical protein VFT74_20385, partial [Isosphaeraceae bacterium]|nr:hypothetical protein [Isosphaeraceae bacterium]
YHPDLKPDWRAAASRVSQVAPESPVVLFCNEPHIYLTTLRYYLDPGTEMVSVPRCLSKMAEGEPAPASIWYVEERIGGIHTVPVDLSRLYEPVSSWQIGRIRLTYNRRKSEAAVSVRARPVRQ